MASSIITFIICIVAIVMKAYIKKEADAFEANRPGQSMPEPTSHEDCEIEHPDNHQAPVAKEQLVDYEPYREAVQQNQERYITTLHNSLLGKGKEEGAPTPLKGKDERPKLHTPEEARRAFIYSEIFTRKYE